MSRALKFLGECPATCQRLGCRALLDSAPAVFAVPEYGSVSEEESVSEESELGWTPGTAYSSTAARYSPTGSASTSAFGIGCRMSSGFNPNTQATARTIATEYFRSGLPLTIL